MGDYILPQYPVYIPSKGRADNCLTARCLVKDNIPFYLVIEQQEYDQYAAQFGEACLLVLPFSNQGSVIPARNWIKEHATAAGYERHWQIDDNIRCLKRLYRNRRIPCAAGIALKVVEDFTDRYENIAISGMNYEMFLAPANKNPPFFLNHRVYSLSLILNSLPHKWRGKYNEDIDLCLQVLTDGWCTVMVNAFFGWKMATMRMRGGNTDELYQGDGRLKMARSLEARWPHIVQTKMRWGRPQHVVDFSSFTQRLRLKPGIDLSKMKTDEYGMRLNQVAPEIKSDEVRALYDRYNEDHGDDD